MGNKSAQSQTSQPSPTYLQAEEDDPPSPTYLQAVSPEVPSLGVDLIVRSSPALQVIPSALLDPPKPAWVDETVLVQTRLRARNLNSRDPVTGKVLLHLVVESGDPKYGGVVYSGKQGLAHTVGLLLAGRADPNPASFAGWTPLHEAVQNHLLCWNSDQNPSNSLRETSSKDNFSTENLRIVQLLISGRANLNLSCGTGLTALQLAVRRKGSLDLLSKFFSARALEDPLTRVEFQSERGQLVLSELQESGLNRDPSGRGEKKLRAQLREFLIGIRTDRDEEYEETEGDEGEKDENSATGIGSGRNGDPTGVKTPGELTEFRNVLALSLLRSPFGRIFPFGGGHRELYLTVVRYLV